MKRFLVICLFAFFVTFLVISEPMAETLRIGIFDMQKIMIKSKAIQKYRQEVGKEIESKRKVFKEKEDAVREIEEKLKKEGQSSAVNETRELREKLADKERELKRLKEDISLELQKVDRELTEKAFKEIGEIIRDIADKENYTIIFEKNSAGIVHFKDSVDITEKIITLYDKRANK